MDIPIYRNKLPLVDENVQVVFTEFKDTHIEARLLDYNNINGMMIYEDATRRKKVYDWKKEIPLNKPTIARVDKIINSNYVQLSVLGFIDKKKDPEDLAKELMKPFNDNKILVNIIKKLTKKFNIEFNEFWTDIVYKIDKIRKDEELDESLLETFNNNLNIVKEKYNEQFITELDKLLNYKIYKLVSRFSLITKLNIQNTMNLLNNIEDKNKWLHTIKYDTGSFYILESSSETSSEQNHQDLINMIETSVSEYNIVFKLDYLAKKI
jgi:translation initiation factor 2 alpha subunit (eIF-2alpha)